jgi:hypothetical protein
MIPHGNRETTEEMAQKQGVWHILRWQQSQHIRHQLAGPPVADIGVIYNGEAPLPFGLPIFVQEPGFQLLVSILRSVVDALQQGAHGHGDGLWQSWQHILILGTGHDNPRPAEFCFGLEKPDVRV